MEFKIHANAMAFSAIKKLKLKARKVDIRFNPYTLARLKERGISIDEVRDTIQNGEFIEYHFKESRKRILLRNKEGICVVVDVERGRVITAYKNKPDDNHLYINRENYLFGRT